MRNQHTVGFSLVELLVVIAIMALLAAIILPVFANMGKDQKTMACIENLREIGVALALYHDDYGCYPPAPRPDYLQLGPTAYQALPYTTAPTSTPAGWQEWQPTATDPNVYAFKQTPTPKVGNFGLATLYYLFLNDNKDYLRTYKLYHCPLQLSTAHVNRGSELIYANSSLKTFDPLWAGYNTYDITYNYDQYQNEIGKFDTTVLGYNVFNGTVAGFPGSASSPVVMTDIKRQLHCGISTAGITQPVPADTVVCWCYVHNGDNPPTYTTIDKYPNAITSTNTVSAVQHTRAAQIYEVLWVDGSVQSVHPYLVLSPVDGSYYWVPPFLFNQGMQ